MSVRIINNRIIATRGDTLALAVPLQTQSGEEYILLPGDKAFLCVKKSVKDEVYTILKTFKGDGLSIIAFELDSVETKVLTEKNYLYEISLELDRGEGYQPFVQTVIDKSKLSVTDELY